MFMLIMVDMFGLFLHLMAFLLLMKIYKGLLLLKKVPASHAVDYFIVIDVGTDLSCCQF